MLSQSLFELGSVFAVSLISHSQSFLQQLLIVSFYVCAATLKSAAAFCYATCSHKRVKSNKHNGLRQHMLLQKRTKKSRKTYTHEIRRAESRLNAGFFTYVTIEWD